MFKRIISLISITLCLSPCLMAVETAGDTTSQTEVVTSGTGLPEVISPLSAEFKYGKPFKYQIVADHNPLGYSVRGLPHWMSRTGDLLFGNAVESGTFKLQISALNMKGLGKSKELTIIVNQRKPEAPHSTSVIKGQAAPHAKQPHASN